MSEPQGRWRRPGVRLAVVVLAGIAIYFLVIFARMSWYLYRTSREVRAAESRVTQLAQQNQHLKQRLDGYQDEDTIHQEVIKSLPLIDPDLKVGILVAGEEPRPADSAPQGAVPGADLASLPAWQQWWWVIFSPMSP